MCPLGEALGSDQFVVVAMSLMDNEGNLPYWHTGLGLDATEAEIRRALSDPAARAVEWENGGLTFILSERHLVIVRTGALGGDVREVHGGWRYLRLVDCLKEWTDIRQTAGAFRKGQEKAQ